MLSLKMLLYSKTLPLSDEDMFTNMESDVMSLPLTSHLMCGGGMPCVAVQVRFTVRPLLGSSLHCIDTLLGRSTSTQISTKYDFTSTGN